tara:strand:- start:189 stop:1133 length:945 start_codon:yes stop_codon:yes gene_type:complete
MATLLLFVLLFFSAALLVMVVYTIDRLNSVEKITSVLNSVIAPSPSMGAYESQAMFEGLSGMTLWEAMSGSPVEGWENESLEPMRPRYRIVLQKHLEAIFDEGLLDGHQETYKHLPSNTMLVSMLRGSVESWIPQNYASGVYQIGLEWSKQDLSEAKRLREKLDLIADEMFSACEIELKNPLSKILLPESEEELLKKSDFKAENGNDEEGTLELPHDSLVKEDTGNIQEGSEEKAGFEKTQSPEVEGTEEPDVAIKPSPALKTKSESNEENAVPGSEKRTSSKDATAGGNNSEKEGRDKEDSAGSGVSAVAEPA